MWCSPLVLPLKEGQLSLDLVFVWDSKLGRGKKATSLSSSCGEEALSSSFGKSCSARLQALQGRGKVESGRFPLTANQSTVFREPKSWLIQWDFGFPGQCWCLAIIKPFASSYRCFLLFAVVFRRISMRNCEHSQAGLAFQR